MDDRTTSPGSPVTLTIDDERYAAALRSARLDAALCFPVDPSSFRGKALTPQAAKATSGGNRHARRAEAARRRREANR